MAANASLRLLIVASGAMCVASACRAQPPAEPAAAFVPTVARSERPSGSAPTGMVWIPGGEFSMGSDAAADVLCERPGVTRDAQPIHRVSVDGFWMDATVSRRDERQGRSVHREQSPGVPHRPARAARIMSVSLDMQ